MRTALQVVVWFGLGLSVDALSLNRGRIESGQREGSEVKGEKLLRRSRRGWMWNQFFLQEEYTGSDYQYIGKVHHPLKRAVRTDWGLANIRDTVMLCQGSRYTSQAVGPTGGTYLYMAPECVLNFEKASWQTNVVLGSHIIGGPHGVCAMASEKYEFLAGLMSYPTSRLTASDIVKFLKSGLDLAS